jgi:hypothetical protein
VLVTSSVKPVQAEARWPSAQMHACQCEVYEDAVCQFLTMWLPFLSAHAQMEMSELPLKQRCNESIKARKERLTMAVF